MKYFEDVVVGETETVGECRSAEERWMNPVLIFFVFSVLFLSCAARPRPVEGPPKSFESDGCSCWPDWDYYDCCFEHDKVYWDGGSAEERKASDRQLKECVAEKGHPFLAPLMYMGVRIGGHGWLPTPFRWGYGYPWPQGYFDSNPQNDNPE